MEGLCFRNQSAGPWRNIMQKLFAYPNYCQCLLSFHGFQVIFELLFMHILYFLYFECRQVKEKLGWPLRFCRLIFFPKVNVALRSLVKHYQRTQKIKSKRSGRGIFLAARNTHLKLGIQLLIQVLLTGKSKRSSKPAWKTLSALASTFQHVFLQGRRNNWLHCARYMCQV